MRFIQLFAYLQGYIPGLFGVSHGALQFMAYEELKKLRSSYFGTPIDHRLVWTSFELNTNCNAKRLVHMLLKYEI